MVLQGVTQQHSLAFTLEDTHRSWNMLISVCQDRDAVHALGGWPKDFIPNADKGKQRI